MYPRKRSLPIKKVLFLRSVVMTKKAKMLKCPLSNTNCHHVNKMKNIVIYLLQHLLIIISSVSQPNNFFVKSQQFHEKYLILAELFLHFFLGFFKQSTIYIPYKCKAKNEIFYLEKMTKTSVPALVFIL